MTSVTHDAVDPVTDRVHDTSWSANLEKPHYADDRDLVVAHAIDAVEHTAEGAHVNLVTHRSHGHPAAFLFDALADAFGEGSDAESGGRGDERAVEWEYVEQCGCGGHVTRVHVADDWTLPDDA